MLLRQLSYAIKNQLKAPISCLSLVLYGIRIIKYFLTKLLKYFQFIDKKYQAGQRYIYQITKTHKDSFTKVRIIDNFNMNFDI